MLRKSNVQPQEPLEKDEGTEIMEAQKKQHEGTLASRLLAMAAQQEGTLQAELTDAAAIAGRIEGHVTFHETPLEERLVYLPLFKTDTSGALNMFGEELVYHVVPSLQETMAAWLERGCTPEHVLSCLQLAALKTFQLQTGYLLGEAWCNTLAAAGYTKEDLEFMFEPKEGENETRT